MMFVAYLPDVCLVVANSSYLFKLEAAPVRQANCEYITESIAFLSPECSSDPSVLIIDITVELEGQVGLKVRVR